MANTVKPIRADESDRIPVLLDTDIGSDIDDAIALAYLLRQPRCDLVGITTVSGDVGQRAGCAAAVCGALRADDVPIVTGLREPLATGPGQPSVPHFPAISNEVRGKAFDDDAINFIRRIVRQRPGEIVLLSIGPFTNVAAVFASDPEIPTLLRGYVSMGGSFSVAQGTEWNCRIDPVAAAITYRWAPNGHVSVGLDVTKQLQITRDQAHAAFSQIKPLWAMSETWFMTRENITLHDPLAAAIVFEPKLSSYTRGNVHVDLGGEMVGETTFAASPEGKHLIAVGVDAFAAESEILEVISGTQPISS